MPAQSSHLVCSETVDVSSQKFLDLTESSFDIHAATAAERVPNAACNKAKFPAPVLFEQHQLDHFLEPGPRIMAKPGKIRIQVPRVHPEPVPSGIVAPQGAVTIDRGS